MLTRIRIEVEGEDSASAAEKALDKYEYALQAVEGDRYGQFGTMLAPPEAGTRWLGGGSPTTPLSQGLGREVTNEVIEYDPGYPGYRGRRVVHFRRVDTRWDLDETGHRPGEGAGLPHTIPKPQTP